MDALTESALDCPWCGESITLLIDASVGQQCYVEDCEVCCRPMLVEASVTGSEISVTAQAENR